MKREKGDGREVQKREGRNKRERERKERERERESLFLHNPLEAVSCLLS